MNSNFDDLLKFYKDSLGTYEKLEKYYKFNEIDSIAKSKIKKLTKKYLESSDKKYIRDINKYEHIRDVLNKKKIKGKQIEQMTSIINYVEKHNMTGGSSSPNTAPYTPPNNIAHYELYDDQLDVLVGTDSYDEKLQDLMNLIRDKKKQVPSLQLVKELTNELKSILGKQISFDLFTPNFKVVRHLSLFEKSDGLSNTVIVAKDNKNVIIPSLLFPYFLYFDINRISTSSIEYAFVTFNESSEDIDRVNQLNNISNKILGLNFLPPPAQPTVPITNFAKGDKIIIYRYDLDLLMFGEFNNDNGIDKITFEPRSNHGHKIFTDLGPSYIANKLIAHKSVDNDVSKTESLKFYFRKLKYIETCAKRIDAVKTFYETLSSPSDTHKLIKNFIINYEFKINDKTDNYDFSKPFNWYTDQFKRFYDVNDSAYINYQQLRKGLTKDDADDETNIRTIISKDEFYQIVHLINEALKNIIKTVTGPTVASPTVAGPTYDTKFLTTKQFADIGEEINFLVAINKTKDDRTITDRIQNIINLSGSTSVASHNKNYLEDLENILDKFTELFILIFNELSLLFSFDHEQFENTNNISYVYRESKSDKQNIIQRNFNALKDAIGKRNNIEKVFIAKDAFTTYNKNDPDEYNNYKEKKKKCTFGETKMKPTSLSPNASMTKINTSNLLLSIGGAISGKVPDSVKQMIAKRDVQLRRIQIMKDIYQEVLDQLSNYKVPNNMTGDTYYITIKYKSNKFFDTSNRQLYDNNNSSTRKPVYVFCGPAINANPGMTDRGNQTCQGICVWLTTDENFYRDDNAILEKLAVDTGFDYAGRGINQTWNSLYEQIETSQTPLPIFTPGIDIIPNNIPLTYDNTMINAVNSPTGIIDLRNDSQAGIHFLKLWAPYVYNLTKLNGETLDNNDLLTHFPIDKQSLTNTSLDKPKVIYTSIQGNNQPLTGSTDPNTWDTSKFKYYNNPHTLADAEDTDAVFQISNYTNRIDLRSNLYRSNTYTIYDPLNDIEKFWDEVIKENPKMGPNKQPIDVNFHKFEGDNLLNPVLLTRFTNKVIKEKLLSKNTQGQWIGPISDLVKELDIFKSNANKIDNFNELLSWLMGLQNNGNPIPNEFVSSDSLTKEYYSNNTISFNGDSNYTYKFYHEGFEYLNEIHTTHGNKAKYLNDIVWNNWNTRMTNQKTYFKQINSLNTNDIIDLNDLKDVIKASFSLTDNDLEYDDPAKDKLDLILEMLPIGLNQFYNRREKEVNPYANATPGQGTPGQITQLQDDFLRHYKYLYKSDSIPPSPPITFSYDNLDNVIGDVAFRLFRQHNTKNVYFTKDEPVQHQKVFPPIIDNNKFDERDVWGIDYFKKDHLPPYDPTTNDHTIDPQGIAPQVNTGHNVNKNAPHHGYISQRTESFPDTSNNFKYGFNSVFKVLFNFVSGYFQTQIEEIKIRTENELNNEIQIIKNRLKIDAADNILNEETKVILGKLDEVLSDNSKLNQLNLKIQIGDLVGQLDKHINKLRDSILHYSTLGFLLENSFRTNYEELWEDEFRFCYDKVIFLYFIEQLENVVKFNDTYDSTDEGLKMRAASLNMEIQEDIRVTWAKLFDQYKYPLKVTLDLFNEIKKECCRQFQGENPLIESTTELQKILVLFWLQQNDYSNFEIALRNYIDSGSNVKEKNQNKEYFEIMHSKKIEIVDQDGKSYNMTIPEIYENFTEINWYDNFIGTTPPAPNAPTNATATYIPAASSFTEETFTNKSIIKFKAKSKINGEFGDTNMKDFTFRNVGGSDDFEGKYVIFDIQNIIFKNNFNFFTLLPILHRLLLLFEAVGSTKFRVYALINDVELLNAPLPTGQLIYEKRRDLMKKGVPTPTQASIQSQADKSGYLDKYYILKSPIAGMTPNKNIVRYRKEYGSDVNNPDISAEYMHDFKFEEADSSKDNLDAFFGYNNWRIFDKKGDVGKDAKTLKIEKLKCKQLVKKYLKNIISRRDNLDDVDGTFKIKLQKETGPGYPTTVEKRVIGTNVAYKGGATNDHIKKSYEVTTGPYRDAYFPNVSELEDTDSKLDQLIDSDINPTEEITFSNIYSDETPEELANQMLLVTKLKLGTGVKIVMQGYSGSGKSFSLFGGDGKSGIVQAVIDEMQSPVVYMRVYEMYGYALPYKFYFEQDPLFYIFAHEFDENLDHQNPYTIFKKEDREKYINGFSEMNSDKPSESINLSQQPNIPNYKEVRKENLMNLSGLLSQIDALRKDGYENGKYKTIKETKNNKESSRSILVIEFKIQVKDKFVPMVLVDMPGREDIKKSYDHEIQPTSALYAGNQDRLSDLKNLILWNPIFLVYIESVRIKLFEIVSNLNLENFKKLVDIYITTIDDLKQTIIDSIDSTQDVSDTFLFYIGINNQLSNQKLYFNTAGAEIDCNNQIYTVSGKIEGRLLINDIRNKLMDNNLNKFTTNTYNEMQNSIRNITYNLDNFEQFRFTSSKNYDDYNVYPNLLRAISISVTILLFVSILKIFDFKDQFDIVFQLIEASLNSLDLSINSYAAETVKDAIMKSYEGIFINENINGIMFNLLKEHPKFDKNTTQGLKDLYNENLAEDNDCAPDPKALYKQHKMLKINTDPDGTLGKFINTIFQERENSYGASPDDVDQLFTELVDKLNNPNNQNVINYCANEIFYLKKPPNPTSGSPLPATLANRKPMIEDILSVYLNKSSNNKIAHCVDFTFLIVVANYLGHIKCNEQIKLLTDMKPFIETVTSE